MSALDYGMAYIANLEKVTCKIESLEIEGWTDGKSTWWLLPLLPSGAKTKVEQKFSTAFSAVEFYKHYCKLAEEAQSEQDLLIKWIKENPEFKGEKVHLAPIEIVNKGSGNCYFPDENCKKSDFVAEVGFVWNSTGFKSGTAQECIEKMAQLLAPPKESTTQLELQAELERVMREIKAVEKQLGKLRVTSPQLPKLKESLNELREKQNEIYSLIAGGGK